MTFERNIAIGRREMPAVKLEPRAVEMRGDTAPTRVDMKVIVDPELLKESEPTAELERSIAELQARMKTLEVKRSPTGFTLPETYQGIAREKGLPAAMDALSREYLNAQQQLKMLRTMLEGIK